MKLENYNIAGISITLLDFFYLLWKVLSNDLTG